MTPEVAQAIDEVRDAHPEATVSVVEDGSGGAFVTVEPVDPGEQYQQRETWIKFHVSFQYPYADVYPHFVRPDLVRTDGVALGGGMAHGQSPGDNQPAVQLSRRSNRLDPGVDTAVLKLAKVLAWLRSQ